MKRMLEAEFVPQVAEDIRNLGYKATEEPTRIPSRNSWLDRLDTLIPGGPRYRPDILVEDGNGFVLVETKTLPLLQGSVVQARRYSNHFDAEVVLCVPDDTWPEVSESVKMFAQDNNVRLCSQSDLEEVLREVLS